MFTFIQPHTCLTRQRNKSLPAGNSRRAAFTLIELTIVIAIIAILASLGLAAANAAYQQSRVQRTQAIVAKIDTLIMEKYESYRTRPVPIRINPSWNYTPRQAAALRLSAIRELMRMEMPDSKSDVVPADGGNPVVLIAANGSSAPSLWKQYNRRANSNAHDSLGNFGSQYWTDVNGSAESLYLILAAIRDGDKSALDFFAPSEIGDIDSDGMNEILDSFGQPIHFLRWAPAYRADLAPYAVTPQAGDIPDPFDPLKADPRWQPGAAFTPFALKPLIWSDGPDKAIGLNFNTPGSPPFAYSQSNPPNDPYFPDPNTGMPVVGAPVNPDYTDNITNHDIEAR